MNMHNKQEIRDLSPRVGAAILLRPLSPQDGHLACFTSVQKIELHPHPTI